MFRKIAFAAVLTVATFGAANADDKLGNFEIQDLMSTFNQAENTNAQVRRKFGLSKRKLGIRKPVRRTKSFGSRRR